MIKHAPINVHSGNERKIMELAFGRKPLLPVQFKYKIGGKVRISKERGAFTKGYLPGFSHEVFTIRQCLARVPPAYQLTAADGEYISRLFYHQELSFVNDVQRRVGWKR